MARDKVACVIRQAAVSRHGAGLGSRRARRRWVHCWARRAREGRSGGRRRTLGTGHVGAGHAGGAQAHGARGAGSSSARQGAAGRGRERQGAAWARGLAKGCALGALSLFLALFDSVFFLSQIFGHCS